VLHPTVSCACLLTEVHEKTRALVSCNHLEEAKVKQHVFSLITTHYVLSFFCNLHIF
jgi:hypothetical protein